jgi:hypothetical protein
MLEVLKWRCGENDVRTEDRTKYSKSEGKVRNEN